MLWCSYVFRWCKQCVGSMIQFLIVSLTFSPQIQFTEENWHVGEPSGPPPTFEQFITVLSNLTELSFSAQYTEVHSPVHCYCYVFSWIFPPHSGYYRICSHRQHIIGNLAAGWSICEHFCCWFGHVTCPRCLPFPYWRLPMPRGLHRTFLWRLQSRIHTIIWSPHGCLCQVWL